MIYGTKTKPKISIQACKWKFEFDLDKSYIFTTKDLKIIIEWHFAEYELQKMFEGISAQNKQTYKCVWKIIGMEIDK